MQNVTRKPVLMDMITPNLLSEILYKYTENKILLFTYYTFMIFHISSFEASKIVIILLI